MSVEHAANATFPSDLEQHLRATCERAGVAIPSGFGFRRTSPSAVDLRLFFGRDARLGEGAGGRLLDALSADPIVADARRKGNAIAVRLAEDYVAWLGAELLAGRRPHDRSGSPLAGRTFVVNFLNPNAVKPLHIGHLRNVSTGAALAASLEAAGARVLRQAYVCDIGRNVCEALAGYRSFHDGEPTGGSGVDRFVGRCYAEYVTATPESGAGSDADDPVAREAEVRGDLADELVRAWLDGDPETRELWSRLTDGAIAGQRASLARLGVTLDRVHLESASLPRVRAFLEEGLASGLLERAGDGGVHYRVGRKEYDRLPLLRSDGLPTEHARVIGLFLIEHESAGARRPDGWVVVCGDEWDAAGGAELELARRLGAGVLADKVRVVAHGMVTLAGSKMKSRDGKALLLDDFLDELRERPEVAALADASAGRVSRELAAQMLVKAYFLCRKISKPLEFEWHAFLDPEHNPAWPLVRAWCRASAADSIPSGAAHDPEAHRVAVLQVFHLRALLADAADGFAATEVAKFAIGLAKWSLEQAPDARTDGVVRAVLGDALRAIDVVQ